MEINGTAFEVIARINNLKQIKTDVYESPDGQRYTLDRFGFHLSIVAANQIVEDSKIVLNRAISDYAEMKTRLQIELDEASKAKGELILMQRELLGRKSSRLIKSILDQNVDPQRIIREVRTYIDMKQINQGK